jgi:hypothetical protein
MIVSSEPATPAANTELIVIRLVYHLEHFFHGSTVNLRAMPTDIDGGMSLARVDVMAPANSVELVSIHPQQRIQIMKRYALGVTADLL